MKAYKYYLKLFVAGLICALLLSSTFSVYSAEVPSDTYTYWYEVGSKSKAVLTTPMYKVKTVISSSSLNVAAINSIDDVFVDDQGITYILDGSASKIYIIDSNFKLIKVMNHVNINGKDSKFTGAKSVYKKDNVIFICDTENARVLLVDEKGNCLQQYLLPNSPVIPKGFKYRPIKVAVDSYGYTYILCDGSYYGAMLFDVKHNFIGFYGSNNVTVTVTGAISSAFSRIFVNNKKKSAKATVLPYTFADLCVDKNNFVYTATGFTKVGQEGQINKLSPGDGSNILDSDDVNFVDADVNMSINLGTAFNQDILGLDVDDYGYIYALESGYGKVYIYDQKCCLLSAFGGGMQSGNQKGTFVTPNAISVYKNRIFVSDSTKCSVTVFEETEYGSLFKSARNMTLNGEYLESEKAWNNVLSMDRNCQYAYSGLALANLAKGDYSKSMKLSKMGYDRSTYALAFEKVRAEWLSKNFGKLFLGFVLLIVLIIVLLRLKSKRKKALINDEKISLLLSVSFHPVDSFNKIQEKNLSSWLICGILVAVYYIVSIARILLGGFSFTLFDPDTFNSLLVFVRSSGLIILWIIVNWAVSTLFSGRGKIKEIAAVTCYSLMPLIIGTVISTILTNVLTPEEGAFITIFQTVMTIYSLLLIAIGTVVIHDYDMKHFIGTTLLTILGMAIIVFLLIMIFLLIQQAGTFLFSVYTEITM